MKNLKKKIQHLKTELLKIEEFLPGTLVEMYVESNQKGGENSSKYGPYYQVSYSIGPDNKSMYIKKKDVPKIQKQLSNYQQFKALLDELLQTQVEHTKQILKEDHHEHKSKKNPRLPASKS